MIRSDLFELMKRIKFKAIKVGLQEVDDVVQEIVCRMLEGKHQHAAVDQMVIDYMRREFGKDGQKKFLIAWDSDLTIEHIDSIPNFVAYKPQWNVDERLTCQKLLSLLKGREQEIIYLYFFEGFTLLELGRIFKMDEARVSQILSEVLKAMKQHLLGIQDLSDRRPGRAYATTRGSIWKE